MEYFNCEGGYGGGVYNVVFKTNVISIVLIYFYHVVLT